jgi:succinoglycan biosynthesis protein ExoM
MTTVDVLICTYKRPAMLAEALRAISTIDRDGLEVRVIVVDNDAAGSARAIAGSMPRASDLSLIYLCELEQNISLARNRALDAARAEYLALIDDDEVPTQLWLRELINAAQEYHADVVFAPVISRYAAGTPQWIIRGGFFDRARHRTGVAVPVREARTGNVLIRRASIPSEAYRFDPQLGLSGGEDSEFFKRLYACEPRVCWCDEAHVYETVTPGRTTVRWLAMRAFRIGSVEGMSKKRAGEMFLAAGKAIAHMLLGSSTMLAFTLVARHRAVWGLWKIAFGFGVLYGMKCGPYAEYRK